MYELDRCNETTDADVRVIDKSNTKTGLQLLAMQTWQTLAVSIVTDN